MSFLGSIRLSSVCRCVRGAPGAVPRFGHGTFARLIKKPMLDCIDKGIWCRSAGSESDFLRSDKPLGTQILFGLDVVNSRAVTETGIYQFAGIVTKGSPNDNHHIGLLCQFHRGVLA